MIHPSLFTTMEQFSILLKSVPQYAGPIDFSACEDYFAKKELAVMKILRLH